MLKAPTINEAESSSPRLRALAIVGAIIVLFAAALSGFALFSAGAGPLFADDHPDCPSTSLGTLTANVILNANGSWTTEDCNSRFRANTDAHTYRFEISEPGRVRINLSSPNADSFLYLMTEDGSRVADDDDAGAGLDARIERTLAPGTYLVEATTVGGRDRGPADFMLSISYVEGCDIIDLGALQPGTDLTASGAWTIDTCGSRFVETHPAYGYSFTLPQSGTVRIDLVSEHGDPVLSLASASGTVIGANDDGGGHRNSRIEQYLQAGAYFIEATTYWERDIQPRSADFDLTVHLVDEQKKQDRFLIKIEASQVPEEVISGETFTVNYRVGNVGGGDLAAVGGYAWVYAIGPRVFERTDEVDASEDRWQSGVSYHTADGIAISASSSIDELPSLELRFREPGPTWIFVAVLVYDEDDVELGWHGRWHDVMVHDGFTFDPVLVRVDDSEYRVSAEADEEGEVANSVTLTADPDTEVSADIQAKAVYTAGVSTQIFPGIFDREALSGLSESSLRQGTSLANPSSSTSLSPFASDLTDHISALGLSEGFAAREAVSPIAIEDLLLGVAEVASQRYSQISGFWKAHQNWAREGRTLAFMEATLIHSQLNYAETVLSPAMTAGKIVQSARDSEMGWEDPDVESMVDDLSTKASCGDTETALRDALALAGSENVDELIDLDAEMRSILPVYGSAIDAVLCAAGDIDSENSRFLASLSIDDNEAIEELFTPEFPEPEAETPSQSLRVIAMALEDGRLELGVELPDGEQVLPETRHMPTDASVGAWFLSGDVQIDEEVIGKIRARRLADGRVEMGFLTPDGVAVTPDLRYIASDIPNGAWFRSAQIEAPQTPGPGQLE